MLVVYNILVTLILLLGWPILLYKVIRHEKYRTGILERLGWISAKKREMLGRDRIWLHAVSVGEVSAAFPLYSALKKKFPQSSIIFSTTTKTGQDWIKRKLLPGDISVYFPIDAYPSVRLSLGCLKPKAVIIIETEIWPNFWSLAHRRGIRVMLVNGRLSDNSFRGYKRILFFIKQTLSNLSLLSVQTEEDRRRFERIGASSHSLMVGGNLKYEASLPASTVGSESDDVKRKFNIDSEVILIGGSTHEGEEELLLDCYKSLRGNFPKLRLILAPRHPERFESVAQTIQEQGLVCLRDSDETGGVFDANSILLLDRMGRLPLYYSLASIAIMGKSLTAHGGQNILEPAALGKVIVFGPHMENFREITQEFLSMNAAMQIEDREGLETALVALLSSPGLRARMGDQARMIVSRHKGAVDKNVAAIEKALS